MLAFVRGRQGTSGRKLRLFACACCRRIWPLLRDERSSSAVEVAEQFADGGATEDELVRTWRKAEGACDTVARYAGRSYQFAALAACAFVEDSRHWAPHFRGWQDAAEATSDKASEYRAQAGFVRDIFGPLPFRQVRVEPAWLTKNVIDLACTIYELCAFDRLLILADALLDAGCNDETMLDHCRQVGHVRGCWVVDLLLGKV